VKRFNRPWFVPRMIGENKVEPAQPPSPIVDAIYGLSIEQLYEKISVQKR
jgi:hypothetical protein